MTQSTLPDVSPGPQVGLMDANFLRTPAIRIKTGVLLQEELYNRSRDYKLSGPGLGSVLRAVAAYGQYKGTLFSM